ncbi:MAG: hypothetical protein LBP59_16135 [Planctomycetaceae bacterium]|nr:hypothetical protein [Planctomycetaceae bacterium]
MSTTACRRDARDPLVSPAIQDRRRDAGVTSDSQARRPRSVGLACNSGSQASRLHFSYKKNCPSCPSCPTCP